MTTFAKVVDAAVKLGLDIEATGEAEREELQPDRSESAIVVALPSITLNLPRGTNDDPEPLHCTIRYFADPDPGALPALAELLTHLAETVGPFTADVAGRGRLGPNDAAVLLVESDAIQDFHDLLGGAMPGGDPDKFPHFVPHVTLAYGADIDLEAMDPAELPASITFDRIALWNGDDRLELDLTGTEEMSDVEPDELDDDDTGEKSLMLAAAFDEAVGAVVAGGASMPTIDTADDLPAAIAYADENPDARWYVEARVIALTADAGVQWSDDPDDGADEGAPLDAPDEDDDPDESTELRGPGGVQAAGALYIRLRSLNMPVEPNVYDNLMAEAAAMGMSSDPIVLSAAAWHDREAAP